MSIYASMRREKAREEVSPGSSNPTPISHGISLGRDEASFEAERSFVRAPLNSRVVSGNVLRDKGKGKAKTPAGSTKRAQQPAVAEDDEDDSKPRKNAYSAELIKQLGFDPTAKDGRPMKDPNVQSKVCIHAHCAFTSRLLSLPSAGFS